MTGPARRSRLAPVPGARGASCPLPPGVMLTGASVSPVTAAPDNALTGTTELKAALKPSTACCPPAVPPPPGRRTLT
ncbi:MAG: hypothetical protein ACRDPD_18025 [Streptosporangiaceae bacterium]